MDGEGLDAHEIVAAGDAGREVEGVGALHGPGGLAAGKGGPEVLDLEPVTGPVVGGGGSGGF